MKSVLFIALFAVLSIPSFALPRYCEERIEAFAVQFPTGTPQRTLFELRSHYNKMSVVVYDSDHSDPHLKAQYDLLYDAAYERGVIRFGVSPEVCAQLDAFRLPLNFGGS